MNKQYNLYANLDIPQQNDDFLLFNKPEDKPSQEMQEPANNSTGFDSRRLESKDKDEFDLYDPFSFAPFEIGYNSHTSIFESDFNQNSSSFEKVFGEINNEEQCNDIIEEEQESNFKRIDVMDPKDFNNSENEKELDIFPQQAFIGKKREKAEEEEEIKKPDESIIKEEKPKTQEELLQELFNHPLTFHKEENNITSSCFGLVEQPIPFIDQEEEKPKKKTRVRQVGVDLNSRNRPDNLRTKVSVHLHASIISFLNLIFQLNKFSNYDKELQIRKLNRIVVGNTARKSRNNTGTYRDILLQKLSDLLNYDISEDFSTKDKRQNKLNYLKFLERCNDQKILSILNEVTVEDYFYRVFLGEENILGEQYEDLFRKKVLTFSKLIKSKVEKECKGFVIKDEAGNTIKDNAGNAIENKEYIDLLVNCAYKDFIQFYFAK